MNPREVRRHDAWIGRGWASIQGRILVNGAYPAGPPGWWTRFQCRRALRWFRRALRVHPESYSSWFAVGKIHQRLGEHERALAAFTRAIVIRPDHPDLFREASLEALDLGQGTDAFHLARAAVTLRPDDPDLVANLALTHLIRGEVELARATIDAALAADPSDPISRSAQTVITEVALGHRPCPRFGWQIDGGW